MTESLAYIVQLDLPGGPIKIGHSRRVRQRFHSFNGSTPVALRFIGVTYPGALREEEMLEATKATVIKGEWRFVTPELRSLLADYCAAGEWHVPALNPRDHYVAANVFERAKAFATDFESSFGYWDAHKIAARCDDKSLLADWHGFKRSHEVPSFAWPKLSLAA